MPSAVGPVAQDTDARQTMTSDQDIHAFRCPGEGDLRASANPATVFINDGSPHDGKNITFSTLVHALHIGYGTSIGFSIFLVLGSYILLKRSPLEPLDLHEIGQHNAIEHNGSVVHDDADGDKYAPEHVDAELLCKFLSKAYSPPSLRQGESENEITVEDLAQTRVERQKVSGTMDAMHTEIARGEFAMVFDIFGKGKNKALNKEDLEVWLKVNRFPDGWAPNHTEKLIQTVAQSKKIRELMKRYQSGSGEEERHGPWSFVEKAVEGLVQKVEWAAHLHAIGQTDAVVNGKL